MKREKLPSRKRKALGRVAVMAVIVFCVNFFMHIGLLFPIQAIWQLQERGGTGWTRVVTRDWVPELHKTHLVYLTENEEALLLGNTYLTLYGWMAGADAVVDCTEDAPIYAGSTYMNRDGEWVWYYFGRVDDPAVATVTILLQSEEWDNDTQTRFRRDIRSLETAEFYEKEGRRYFLLKDNGEWDYDTCSSPEPVIIGYDSAGEEVARLEIDRETFANFG